MLTRDRERGEREREQHKPQIFFFSNFHIERERGAQKAQNHVDERQRERGGRERATQAAIFFFFNFHIERERGVRKAQNHVDERQREQHKQQFVCLFTLPYRKGEKGKRHKIMLR